MECKTCFNAKRKENSISKKHAEFVGHQRHRGEDDINFTYKDWLEVVIFFGGCCAYCGRSMRKSETLTRDHLVSYADGGKTEPGNILPACPGCNSSKGKQDIKEWYMKQPFFSQERLNRIFQWRAIIKAAGGGTCDE
jgi:5-methylcytosine-specific restriction endonuclease McrA